MLQHAMVVEVEFLHRAVSSCRSSEYVAQHPQERGITGDEYDKKARELKERQTEITLRIESTRRGEGDYRATLETLISLASRASDRFARTETRFEFVPPASGLIDEIRVVTPHLVRRSSFSTGQADHFFIARTSRTPVLRPANEACFNCPPRVVTLPQSSRVNGAMRPTLILLVVGLTPDLHGVDTPRLASLASRGGARPLATITPAVTCSVQSTLLTGLPPSVHGRRSERLVFSRSRRSVALAAVEPADRRRENLGSGQGARPFLHIRQAVLIRRRTGALRRARCIRPTGGRSPTFTRIRQACDRFWGPLADITASRWIADATRHVMATRDPTLTLTYLPHLDYDLQRFGPHNAHPAVRAALRAVDDLAGELIAAAKARGARVIVVSEYGITPVTDAIFVNRALRAEGLIAVRDELGRELLDAGASRAFALADHQVAHVYVREPGDIEHVGRLISGLDGVETVWGDAEKRAHGVDHPRSGELVAVSRADRWFAYHYWLDEARAPNFRANRRYSSQKQLFGSCLWKTKAWTWRRSGSRRRLRAQWMKSANSSSVVSSATVRRTRARSRGL
jgi:Type I phosphodiesterase / nucleotide pyrophosphatase